MQLAPACILPLLCRLRLPLGLTQRSLNLGAVDPRGITQALAFVGGLCLPCQQVHLGLPQRGQSGFPQPIAVLRQGLQGQLSPSLLQALGRQALLLLRGLLGGQLFARQPDAALERGFPFALTGRWRGGLGGHLAAADHQ